VVLQIRNVRHHTQVAHSSTLISGSVVNSKLLSATLREWFLRSVAKLTLAIINTRSNLRQRCTELFCPVVASMVLQNRFQQNQASAHTTHQWATTTLSPTFRGVTISLRILIQQGIEALRHEGAVQIELLCVHSQLLPGWKPLSGSAHPWTASIFSRGHCHMVCPIRLWGRDCIHLSSRHTKLSLAPADRSQFSRLTHHLGGNLAKRCVGHPKKVWGALFSL